jgi:hypothetical protein
MTYITAKPIVRTGRVQNWIDNPDSRLPVSCTVFVVDDTMEGPEGIEASWRFVSHALRNGAGAAVHLSKLRAKGADNGRGLVSSGPVSFARIYSSLNETLRRGGVYKNGAVVIHLDLCHPDILDFITASRAELPWVKRCVDITTSWWKDATLEVRAALLVGIAGGDIWLNKVRFDSYGARIYGNVCLEVYLPHRGTCLLEHVNLGAVEEPSSLPGIFATAMTELVELHGRTGVGDSGEYLDPSEDRQVGLGMLGLANYLSLHGITYAELADAFEAAKAGDFPHPSDRAGVFVWWLDVAIREAERIARAAGMDRAFAIAPTASCSYANFDYEGYTTCPEIAPPVSQLVDRDSDTFGVQSFDYGNVETAADVGYETFRQVADGIISLYESTGLFHGYSLNTWSDQVTYDEQFVNDWIMSPQTSMYYALPTQANTQDKSDAFLGLLDLEDLLQSSVCSLDANTCTSCSE